MFVKEVRVSFGRTINLGNFESTRVEMTECAVVTDNNADEVAEALYEELKRKVELKCEVLRDRRAAEGYREAHGRPPIVDGKHPGNAAS